MQMELAKTLRNYDGKNLSKDILTGLIIMAVSIPISMGYAQIRSEEHTSELQSQSTE